MIQMGIARDISIFTSISIVFLFLRKVFNWIIRIRNYRKTMPAIPALFPSDSQYRQLWPKKWQRFHKDWHMQYQRSIYRKLDTDIFVLVCLFEYDKVFVSDPAAVLELKVVRPKDFPRDMQVFKKVYPIANYQLNLVCGIWKECCRDNRRRLETSQENHGTYLFSEKYATCSF
jgi:hypothetical protein